MGNQAKSSHQSGVNHMRSQPASKERLYWLDNVKFLLIWGVLSNNFIIGFFSKYGLEEQKEFTQLLGMPLFLTVIPLFAFVSGYFSKSTVEHPRKTAQRIWFLLLLYLLLYVERLFFKGTPFLFRANLAEWFILYMLGWVLCTALLHRLQPYFVLPAAFAVFLIVGLNSTNDVRFFCFLPFFLAGYYCKRDWLLYLKRTRFHWLFKLGAALVVAGLYAVAFLGTHKADMITLTNVWESVSTLTNWAGRYSFLAMIGCALASILMCICILILVPQRRIPVISMVGSRALQIYVWQCLIFTAVARVPFLDSLWFGLVQNIGWYACTGILVVFMILFAFKPLGVPWMLIGKIPLPFADHWLPPLEPAKKPKKK